MILWIFSCASQMSSSETIDIIQNVEANPLQTLALCSKIVDPHDLGECLSIGAHALKGNTSFKRQLCEAMSGALQSECYFELAEELGSIKDCDKAGTFRVDCQSHILQANCGQFQTLHAVQQYIDTHQIEFTHGIEGLVYKCILDKKNFVPIKQCQYAINPSRCRTIAKEIYTTDLQLKPLNCESLPKHTTTSGSAMLQAELDAHLSVHCPDQTEFH